jgi:predicted GNAT family acetyltransferase
VIDVRDNPDESRYDVAVDGSPAGFARYVRRGNRMIFVHTEVDEAFEGQGVGSGLAQAALDDVRARGLRAVPLCPFIKAYIDRHPELQGLVDVELMAMLDPG